MHRPRRSDDHDDFGGLLRDLRSTGSVMGRRQLLRFAASVGALSLFGCGDEADANGNGNGDCDRIPEETAGPFPGEGSNGPNVLNQTGVVRRDIRSSFAGLTGTADGIPLAIVLNVVSASTCEPLAARAVYLWHCDRLGRYSLYTNGATNQNYLRGVQEADASGQVTFDSIFPACYQGRWPHFHFEVYPNLSAATSASDMVFSDGASLELATMAGSVGAGFTATLTVAV